MGRLRAVENLLISFILMGALVVAAQAQIAPGDAHKHVGSEQTVCGPVASTHYARTSNGRPTFLNLGRPYPNQVFTAVIWGSERGKFPEPPEEAYAGKHICVSGRVSSYRGVPQIEVGDPSQIAIQ